MRAARRPTFSTWAAAPTRSRLRTRSEILLCDKNVKAVLINIFGGILRCDTLANGVVAAARDLESKLPHRRAHGRHQCGAGPRDSAEVRLELHGGGNMKDAAEKVVAAAGRRLIQ